MPILNDFEAHIITIELGKEFPRKSQVIQEFRHEVKGNTVSCYIPVNSGRYFAAWWWPKGQRKGKPYSVQFSRDGEWVVHLIFGGEESAYFSQGGVAGDWEDDKGKKWNFQFSKLKCTGKEDDTIVPADIGQLELVIRKFEERDLDVYSGASNDKEEEEEEGGSGGSQNDTQDEDEEGSGDDSDGDTSDESQDEKYVKPTRRRKLKGTITEFSEYKMAKLRQTHSANLVQPGSGERFKGHIKPLRSMPRRYQGDEKNVIARFIFYYTSSANAKACASPVLKKPKVRSTPPVAIPEPKRRRFATPSPTTVKPEREPTPQIKTETDIQVQVELDKLLATHRIIGDTICKLLQAATKVDEPKAVTNNRRLAHDVEDNETKPNIKRCKLDHDVKQDDKAEGTIVDPIIILD